MSGLLDRSLARPWLRSVLAVPLLAASLARAAAGGDNFPDVVVTDLNSLLVFHGDGAGGFRSPPTRLYIAPDVEPWSVALGDLTGDGALDIVSADRFGPHISIFASTADGFEDARIISTPQRPYDVDIGDLDGDRDLDLVVTCNFDPGQILLLYNDGKGGFTDTERINPGGSPFNSELVDLDGKKGLDLVVVRNTGLDLAIYLNLGDGSFESEGTVPAGADPKAIRSGDFDGDGFADVVVANDTAGKITVFRGDGFGGLHLKGTYPSGTQPREVAVVDLNADRIVDLVVADGRNSNVVSRFLGNGDATFRGPVDFATGPRPNSVAAADFDLDGKPDVAVANWSLDNPSLATLTILFGDGSGDFPRKADFVPAGGFQKITALAVGQLDYRPVRFKRGDAGADGRLSITDPILVLRFMFLSGALPCADAADADDNGTVDITDAILILSWLFQGGNPLTAPFPDAGLDPTPDTLGCGD